MLLGGRDIEVFDIHRLRDEVVVIGDTRLLESSIADFLRLGNPGLTRGQMHHVLEVVGLDAAVAELEEGLDTVLTPQGIPLTTSEELRLKIAHALALQPRVLVFTVACDLMSMFRRRRILEHLKTLPDCTFIYLSNRHDLDGFDRYLRLGSGVSETCDSLQDLVAAELGR